MADESLNDILNNDEPTAEVEAPQAETEAPQGATEAAPAEELSSKLEAKRKLEQDEQSDAPVRDEKGRFAPKGEKETEEAPVEAPPASEGEQGPIPIAALKDERARRQAAEERARYLEEQFRLFQQAQQQQPAPDQWEDPEGYAAHLRQSIKAEAVAEARQEAIQAFQTQRIAHAATQFMADKPDYQDVINVFGQMANVNPRLMAEMQAAPNPAEYAYNAGKTQMEIAQYGGVEGLINARVEARLREQTQQVGQVAQRLPSAPPTISGDRSTGPRSGPQWQGPTDIGDLLA